MKVLPLIFILINVVSILHAQTIGCTDPLANNFNANATVNDGSCLYNFSTISTISSFDLDSTVKETSGLILWQNKLWTQNDDADKKLYAIDTLDGTILSSVMLNGIENIDWEEISNDDSFIYVGDFGNNVSGNRTNLRIYRVNKQSILQNNVHIDTISFSYANQIDFTPQTANQTDFDCEAFVVTADSIYLFTKQWLTHKTSCYSIPNTSGHHLAQLQGALNVDGLITGSVMLESQKLIALCGYSAQLQPFLYLLYDYTGTDFFGGNKRKITVDLPFHQVEGIATHDGLKVYLSNEALNYGSNSVPPQLHTLDLNSFLSNYLSPNSTGIDIPKKNRTLTVFPNPASDQVTVYNPANETITLRDFSGKIVFVPFQKEGATTVLNISKLPEGVYLVCLTSSDSNRITLLVKE